MVRVQLNAVMALFLTIVLFFLLLSPFFYSKNFTFLFMDHAKDVYGKEDARLLHEQVYDFLLFGTPLDYLVFYPEEIDHMADVRSILIAGEWVFLFCVFSIFILSLIRLRYDIFNERVALFFGFYGYLGVLFLLLVIFLFNFAFDLFHKLLFSGNYTFPQSYVLVNLYTIPFFQTIGVSLFSIWIIFSGLSLWYYSLRIHS